MKWLGAFATAAVVVLALTVALEQERQAPVPVAEEADGLRIDRDDSAAASNELRVESTAAAREKLPQAASQEQTDRLPAAEAWVEKLLWLKQSGRDLELTEELAAFHKAYPDYELPPELED